MRLQSKVRRRLAQVVHRDAVVLAVLLERGAAQSQHQDRRGFGPRLIRFDQAAKRLVVLGPVAFRRDDEPPGLFVESRRGPPRRLEQRLELFGFDRLIRERTRAPAVLDLIEDGVVGGGGVVRVHF